MGQVFRQYRDADYAACEALVSNAWDFERIFAPHALARLVAYLYTSGPLAVSNFARVVEIDGQVVGFIFGLNQNQPVPKHEMQKLSKRLAIMARLMLIRGLRFSEKTRLLKAFGAHEVNRTALVGRDRSELTLFVVDPAHQGAGFGKKLFADFADYCRGSDVKNIVVETNKIGASSFYERIGFKMIGDFHSPLHAYATPDGQACMLEFSLIS